jgi:hypothetical protein
LEEVLGINDALEELTKSARTLETTVFANIKALVDA